jgi:hypothetical protein
MALELLCLDSMDCLELPCLHSLQLLSLHSTLIARLPPIMRRGRGIIHATRKPSSKDVQPSTPSTTHRRRRGRRRRGRGHVARLYNVCAGVKKAVDRRPGHFAALEGVERERPLPWVILDPQAC